MSWQIINTIISVEITNSQIVFIIQDETQTATAFCRSSAHNNRNTWGHLAVPGRIFQLHQRARPAWLRTTEDTQDSETSSLL